MTEQSKMTDAQWLANHAQERQEQKRSISTLSNTEILCFVLGWQGGTVHQVAEILHVEIAAILDADHDQMHTLCRAAQQVNMNDDDEDQDFEDREPDESMDGDFDSAMESAGHVKQFDPSCLNSLKSVFNSHFKNNAGWNIPIPCIEPIYEVSDLNHII